MEPKNILISFLTDVRVFRGKTQLCSSQSILIKGL